MSDAEIRKAIDKEARAEMNREMAIGVPLLLGCCVWIYLIAAL